MAQASPREGLGRINNSRGVLQMTKTTGPAVRAFGRYLKQSNECNGGKGKSSWNDSMHIAWAKKEYTINETL